GRGLVWTGATGTTPDLSPSPPPPLSAESPQGQTVQVAPPPGAPRSAGSCTRLLRIIPSAPKSGKMPPSHHIVEGATPWSHTFFTTNSLYWPSCGSSSCCTSLGPSQA